MQFSKLGDPDDKKAASRKTARKNLADKAGEARSRGAGLPELTNLTAERGMTLTERLGVANLAARVREKQTKKTESMVARQVLVTNRQKQLEEAMENARFWCPDPDKCNKHWIDYFAKKTAYDKAVEDLQEFINLPEGGIETVNELVAGRRIKRARLFDHVTPDLTHQASVDLTPAAASGNTVSDCYSGSNTDSV